MCISSHQSLLSLIHLLFRSVQKQMVDLLEGWLRHKSDMVNFEAARAICEMKNVSPQQLTKSIAGKIYPPLRICNHEIDFHVLFQCYSSFYPLQNQFLNSLLLVHWPLSHYLIPAALPYAMWTWKI